MASGDGPVLKLEHYTKTTPPGWRPGDPQYPVKRYLELVELWHALTDLVPEKVGVAVVGRLQGRVHTLALSLAITKQDGTTLRGLSALAFQGERATQGPAGQMVPATPNGLQAVCDLLRHKHGATEQGHQGVGLDEFLDLRRGRHSLMDYLIEYEHRYDKACTSSGLAI